MANVLFSILWRALYTTPMPPVPTTSRNSYVGGSAGSGELTMNESNSGLILNPSPEPACLMCASIEEKAVGLADGAKFENRTEAIVSVRSLASISSRKEVRSTGATAIALVSQFQQVPAREPERDATTRIANPRI